MAHELAPNVHLSTPVLGVDHAADGVVVRTARGDVAADRLVVAAPPQTVDRLTFRPTLPARRRACNSELTLGRLAKFQAVYSTSLR